MRLGIGKGRRDATSATGNVTTAAEPGSSRLADYSNEQLRDLLATLELDAAMVRDFSGTIRFWSRGCERLYGWTAAEAIGQASHSLLKTIFPTPLSEIEATLLRDGEWRGDLIHQSRDGKRLHVIAHKALRRDAAGTPAAVMESLVDVTHQRDIEARLAQSQKMEAIGQLTGGFAHDFNNLLLAIGLNLEIIESEVGQSESLQPIVEGASHAIEQARLLIAQLLAFGRRQSLSPSALDVSAALIETTKMLRRTLPASITVESVLAADLWSAFTDGPQFETAVLNLAINARDAMPKGGRLLIESTNCPVDDATAVSLEIKPGDYVTVAISDTGSGIAPEILARVFEPFFTTKAVNQGTGLGLSQVYGFMKQTGGHVAIYSEVGQGTRLTLYLPRSPTPATTRDGTAGPTAVTGRGEEILLVEDNAGVRAAVAKTLTGLGYHVKTATTGEEALVVLKSDAKIDLLFTDIVLPGGMVGTGLAQAAHQLRPRLRVLLTSGYSQAATQSEETSLRDERIILKPYTMTQLAQHIRKALDTPI